MAGVLATLLVRLPSADATSTILCKGFKECRESGYEVFGYAANYKKMWWRMYSGHNCTNYVAYRMVRSGLSEERPWNGSGDARNWGVVFSKKTNQNPMVGSVAWWSSNHVAYVQQIIDEDTIVISEDHWGGDFDWRMITRSGGGWPTGFIHLNDERIDFEQRPAMRGQAQVDQLVRANPGKWEQPAQYAYQWLAKGKKIKGATKPTFTPPANLVGVPLQVRIRAKAPGYRVRFVRSPAASTAPGVFTTTAEPTIAGIAKVGAELTAAAPVVAPEAGELSYAWFADGALIKRAGEPTLILSGRELDKRIVAQVTATRPGYTDAVLRSAATEPVGPEKITVEGEPRLRGPLIAGRSLSVQTGVATPSDVNLEYRWFRDGKRIRGADQAQYALTGADVNTHIAVRVIYTKLGYTTVVQNAERAKAVRSRPRIMVHGLRDGSIRVRVRAAGVDPVRGSVLVKTDDGRRAHLDLRRGEASFQRKWMRPGEYALTVTYQGSKLVVQRTRKVTVTVR